MSAPTPAADDPELKQRVAGLLLQDYLRRLRELAAARKAAIDGR